MDILNDLKKLLENQEMKKEDPQLEQEKRFLSEAAAKLSSAKNVTSIQGYDPREMALFLERPIGEIKEIMGGEWAEMADSDFSTFLYIMTKKINKSNSLLNWH